MSAFGQYIATHGDQILQLTLEHIEMTAIAVGISILVGVPIGILISYVKGLNKPVLGIANVVQAIPSMALLGLFIPLFGIGKLPAIVMVIIFSLLPIIKNTYTGISSVDPLSVESGRAIGLNRWQILWKVRLPMALPVIMAGIRISAVTAVGTMTMAAYVGAGGLGYLIFAGIRTVNNIQILAGAIPSALLALLVDLLIGTIERLVTPVNLQKDFAKTTPKSRKHRKVRDIVGLVISILLIIAIVIGSTVGNAAPGGKQITFGAKDFTEEDVLMNVYSDYIEEKTDIHVRRKPDLGGSEVAYEALKQGSIDAYPEYTGTLYGSIYKHGGTPQNRQQIHEIITKDAAKDGLTLLNETPCNDTYTLSVRKDTAEKYHLRTIEDLAKVSGNMRLGSTIEFLNRQDAMLSVQKKYPELHFKKTVAIDNSPRYTALMNNEVDVIDAFSTEGLLLKYPITVLQDTRHAFPAYYVVPCFSAATLKKYPELAKVCNELSPHLTESAVMKMNYQVDVEGKDPEAVAHAFLVENHLIKA